MRHNFASGWFTYATVFSDDAPVHTTITNTEELVQNFCYTEELIHAGFFSCASVFVCCTRVHLPPNTMSSTSL